jgi:hypothetical protein
MKAHEPLPITVPMPEDPMSARRSTGLPRADRLGVAGRLSDQLGALDDVGGVSDDAGHQRRAPGQSQSLAEDDFDLDADLDRWVADIEAGRWRIPGEADWELTGPAASISLGDASDLDPALLAAMCGRDGLGGEALSAAFGQDQAADALRPGPVLFALTEQAASDFAALSDNQLTGALSAARRLENRAAYLQTIAIAEFARRREAERETAKSRKVPLHCRPGQFPGEELAAELVCTARYADERIWQATDLAARLPRTLAGMADGTIDATRAYIIWSYTWSLTPLDADRADEVLAAAAPGLRPDQLARRAAALEMRLDPAAVKRRRERARRDGQRVEVRHERSGNAVIAGRELDPVTALAAKANIDALAVRLRDANGEGSLQHLRAWIMTELLQGRNPLDRFTTTSPTAPADPGAGLQPSPALGTPGTPGTNDGESGDLAGEPAGPGSEDWLDDPGYRDEDREAHGYGLGADPDPGSADEEETVSPLRRAQPGLGPPGGAMAPLPALINILVPAGTLLGWSAAPAQVGNWGLLDAEETKAFARAASLSPRTRFCMTLVAPDGTALAHGCSRGRHPLTPPTSAGARPDGPPGLPPPQAGAFGSRAHPPPDPAQVQQLADLIRQLNIAFRPVIRGGCDHADAEERYSPSRGLKHLVRARTATCTAPACNAQAVYCDLDHTVPYPDGLTCQCNLAPKCRRHHRCKQAAGWTVEQPEPGVLRWTVPSGRMYATAPTVYDL